MAEEIIFNFETLTFNEAAPVRARKFNFVFNESYFRYSFNEAAPVRARKWLFSNLHGVRGEVFCLREPAFCGGSMEGVLGRVRFAAVDNSLLLSDRERSPEIWDHIAARGEGTGDFTWNLAEYPLGIKYLGAIARKKVSS